MNKKGFTLIELLAVIVILAIIALIAVPIVLGIIEDSRKSATLRSAENYLSGVEQAVAKSMLNGDEVIDLTYKINSDGNICLDEACTDILKVEVDGEKPSSGSVTLSEGQITYVLLTLNSKDIEMKEGKLVYKETTGGGNNTAVCTYVDSEEYENTAGTIDRNDIVTCGTESFYVIDNDGESVTMLSMYNLNVGDTKYPNDETNGVSDGYVKQDEHVKGAVLNAEGSGVDTANSYGMIAFSTSNYWYDSTNDVLKSKYGTSYPAWVYTDKDGNIDSTNSVYTHVNNYETYLKEELGVETVLANLMSYDQAIDIGCDEAKITCGPDLGSGSPANPAPAWIYSTSYWLGTSKNKSTLYNILSYGPIYSANIGGDSMLGIRPVVTISTDEFN